MSSIRRRVAVLAVLLLAGAGALPWPGRPVAAAPAQAQPPQTPAPQTPAPQPPAPQTPAQPAQPAPAGQPAQPDAQPPPPADGQPTFRAGINFVRVDVIVTDSSGNPVTDLTQADFEVAEDGKPQTVETFRLVQIDTTAPVESQRRLTTRDDEEIAAAGRGRPHLRLLPRRLPRAARQQHGVAQAAGRVHDDAARPPRPGRGDVPAQPARQRDA